MNLKKTFQMTLICILSVACVSSTVIATETQTEIPVEYTANMGATRAYGSFNMTIVANSKATANSVFSLAAGDTVRINASYVPDASMDFGLVDSEGTFYYFNVTDGSIDKTIQISKTGNYTLQIRNNSSAAVVVSGFVEY